MEHETSEVRIERGVQRLAALVKYWLAHNLSQDKLATIIRWSYGETCGFDGGAMAMGDQWGAGPLPAVLRQLPLMEALT